MNLTVDGRQEKEGFFSACSLSLTAPAQHSVNRVAFQLSNLYMSETAETVQGFFQGLISKSSMMLLSQSWRRVFKQQQNRINVKHNIGIS